MISSSRTRRFSGSIVPVTRMNLIPQRGRHDPDLRAPPHSSCPNHTSTHFAVIDNLNSTGRHHCPPHAPSYPSNFPPTRLLPANTRGQSHHIQASGPVRSLIHLPPRHCRLFLTTLCTITTVCNLRFTGTTTVSPDSRRDLCTQLRTILPSPESVPCMACQIATKTSP